MAAKRRRVQSGALPRRTARGRRERGTVFVEFSLVFIPLFALLLLIMDFGWIIFAQASLQEAAREAVRYGITGQIASGCSGLDCSIRKQVVAYSFGFVRSSNASSLVSIHYYSPTTLTDVTGTSSATLGGNIVQVSISNVTVKSFAGLLQTGSPVVLAATSSDVMESLPVAPIE